jgi:hypothetical protein
MPLKFAFITLLILIFSKNGISGTFFTWESDLKDPTKGTCYQVDELTNGKNFKTREKIEKCRPATTVFLFISAKGQCYEVDNETNGKKFIELTKIDFCKPRKTEKKFLSFGNKAGCYEVDTETSGQHFHKLQASNECQVMNSTDLSYAWKYQSPGKGECIKIIKQTASEVPIYLKVDALECKPNNTKLVFYRTGDFNGICAEEDETNPKNYSHKVLTTLCKNNIETAFIFFTPPRSKTGKCYEIDVATKGNQYLNQVDSIHCKP